MVLLLDLPMKWPILLSISEWSWKCLVVTQEIQGKLQQLSINYLSIDFFSSSYRKFRWLNLAGYCGLRILFHGRLTQYVHSVLDDDSIPYVTLPVAVFLNILNLMITIFSYRLVKTDFLGGWKKRGGEMSIDIDTSKSKQFID